MKLLVRAMTWEADGVLSVVLTEPDGVPLPAWEPGAHLDLDLGDGLVRQYSLCGDPGDWTRYEVAVLREERSRGGSRYVHETLRPGQLVEVRGPRNHFRLEDAERYVFIAGGIGITPILPMLAAVADSGQPYRLHYGGRRRAGMAFTGALAEYGDAVHLAPQDEVGLLDLDTALGDAGPGTLVYCCGPAPLIDAVVERCPPELLRVERFAAPEREPLPAGAVEVELARSGRTVLVPPDRSILQVLLDEGVEVANDCRDGICGSCETKVIAGEVDHRDHVLTDRERREGATMMVCVSRACGGRLVLDR
ncbi:PDR/VanB family oxidoreductase [Amycolatopsis alkalitolerans]|uniref:Oxidoreductase n=1 Tax=Amycolatopsis alkalitolerans TaxID=2547244 RepID=A0A5C4M300_9PSEU|nr:PDR/VanB family oxidoreductase [Amycolatopsis alkalitolerans]TNC25171.1 oxidoreductase [Amycolatopsis alkalitolerans]